jgi:hypothetical protein
MRKAEQKKLQQHVCIVPSSNSFTTCPVKGVRLASKTELRAGSNLLAYEKLVRLPTAPPSSFPSSVPTQLPTAVPSTVTSTKATAAPTPWFDAKDDDEINGKDDDAQKVEIQAKIKQEGKKKFFESLAREQLRKQALAEGNNVDEKLSMMHREGGGADRGAGAGAGAGVVSSVSAAIGGLLGFGVGEQHTSADFEIMPATATGGPSSSTDATATSTSTAPARINGGGAASVSDMKAAVAEASLSWRAKARAKARALAREKGREDTPVLKLRGANPIVLFISKDRQAGRSVDVRDPGAVCMTFRHDDDAHGRGAGKHLVASHAEQHVPVASTSAPNGRWRRRVVHARMPMQLSLGSHTMVYTCVNGHGLNASASRVLLVKASNVLVLHDEAEQRGTDQSWGAVVSGDKARGARARMHSRKKAGRWWWDVHS